MLPHGGKPSSCHQLQQIVETCNIDHFSGTCHSPCHTHTGNFQHFNQPMTFWPRAETVTNFDDPRYWSTIPDLEPTPNAMP